MQKPLVYTFQSLCDPASPNSPGTYHVTIDGPGQAKLDVAPDGTASGELPAGRYVIAWKADNGESQQVAWSSSQGPFNWTFCGKP